MANQVRRIYILDAMLLLLACMILSALPHATTAQDRPNDVERAFESAIRLHQAGDILGAITGYKTILSTNPDRIDVRSNLGAAYSRLGRYEEAIEQYKLALQRDTRNQTIRRNLALAYYKAAMFAEAVTELTRFVAEASQSLPERKDAILVLADCQVRLGEYKKVIELLSPLESTETDNRMLAYLLGSAYVSDGQAQRGQELIDRVFRGEDSAEARLLIGSILLLADDGQAAVKELERAIELNPKLPGLRAWYGRALMRLGDPEKAKTAFRNELADNPNDFDANLYIGVLLKRDRMLDEASGYLSRAIRLRPRDYYARYHMGALYSTLGKPGEARVLLEGVAKEYPEFIEARVLLAKVYYRLNRKADGDREQAAVQKLTSEKQSKQPGVQPDPTRTELGKPPAEVQNPKPRQL